MKHHINWKYIGKTIGKAAIVAGILTSIVTLAYFILKWCGFTDMELLRESLGNTVWLYVAICLLQTFQVVFIPISNQIITIPACLVFKDHLAMVFLASWAGIELGTIILYFLGRYGGKKVIAWVLSDKKKADKCSEWLNKGNWLYPIGMLIPFLPDDILTTLAGTAKYNFWYVLGVSLVTRGICVACSVWGFGCLMQHWWGWIIMGAGAMLLLAVTIILFRITSKKGNENGEKIA